MVCDAFPNERTCNSAVEAVARYVWLDYQRGNMDPLQMFLTNYPMFNAFIQSLCAFAPVSPEVGIFCVFAESFFNYCTWFELVNIPFFCKQSIPNCRVCQDFGCPPDQQCHGRNN
jgi:hypothetical protein